MRNQFLNGLPCPQRGQRSRQARLTTVEYDLPEVAFAGCFSARLFTARISQRGLAPRTTSTRRPSAAHSTRVPSSIIIGDSPFGTNDLHVRFRRCAVSASYCSS